jgi:hypothetical protein
MHWYLKLRNSVFFNMTIRVFLESFIEIALTAAINIKNVRIFLTSFLVALQLIRRYLLLLSLNGPWIHDPDLPHHSLNLHSFLQESDRGYFYLGKVWCILWGPLYENIRIVAVYLPIHSEATDPGSIDGIAEWLSCPTGHVLHLVFTAEPDLHNLIQALWEQESEFERGV